MPEELWSLVGPMRSLAGQCTPTMPPCNTRFLHCTRRAGRSTPFLDYLRTWLAKLLVVRLQGVAVMQRTPAARLRLSLSNPLPGTKPRVYASRRVSLATYVCSLLRTMHGMNPFLKLENLKTHFPVYKGAIFRQRIGAV